MVEKYGFVYIWFDRKHKRYYIGCHWGSEDDGYICSSNWMRDAHRRRPEDFKRRIIIRVYIRQELLNIEYKYLSLIKDEELGKKYYNLTKHRNGHWASNITKKLTISQRISITMTDKWSDPEFIIKMKDVHGTVEWKKTASENAKHKRPNRKKKETPKKKTYKDVLIYKNTITKIIKSNQVPQYSKYGWMVAPAGFEPT